MEIPKRGENENSTTPTNENLINRVMFLLCYVIRSVRASICCRGVEVHSNIEQLINFITFQIHSAQHFFLCSCALWFFPSCEGRS